VRQAGELAGSDVVEVGPGPGGLTRALLESPCRQVIAVEKDRRCLAALAELAAAYPGRLAVVEGDALKLGTARLGNAPRHIVSNLPYNIGSELLVGWLHAIAADATVLAGVTLMFQREVALRLAARPGSADYGRLSILAQWLCEVRLAFDVNPAAFVPPPQVTSTVVRLLPRPQPLAPAVLADLERVTAATFGQRRKMLRQSLKQLTPRAEALLAAAGIAPTRRPEELDVEAFCRLARLLREPGL
jgi:16S rRNA (adenine1518-N6/adenine1519-N6)-dimethyltransferase